MYRKGLEKLSEDALVQLSNDYRANNANAMVKGKLADINEVLSLKRKLAPLDNAEICGELKESDRGTYEALIKQSAEAEAKVCENSIIDLEENAFLGEEIGKATINVPTVLKDQSRKHTEKDIVEYEELMNGQAQAKDD